MKNILVAIDAPKNAEQLIAEAVKLAKLTDGKIWILHVTEPNPDDFLALESGPQYVYDKRTEDRKKEADYMKKCAEEIVEKHNIPSEGLLVEGSSLPKSIKAKVEEHNIDLVIAGHQKKNFLYGMFTSNKKKDLVDELKIPLLAVPLQNNATK